MANISREQDIYDLIQESKITENQALESEHFKLTFDDTMNKFTIKDKIDDKVIVIGDYSKNHLALATKDEKLNKAIENSFNILEKSKLDRLVKEAREKKEQALAEKARENNYER